MESFLASLPAIQNIKCHRGGPIFPLCSENDAIDLEEMVT